MYPPWNTLDSLLVGDTSDRPELQPDGRPSRPSLVSRNASGHIFDKLHPKNKKEDGRVERGSHRPTGQIKIYCKDPYTNGTNFCCGAEYRPFAFCTAVMLPLARNAPNIQPAKNLVTRGT